MTAMVVARAREYAHGALGGARQVQYALSGHVREAEGVCVVRALRVRKAVGRVSPGTLCQDQTICVVLRGYEQEGRLQQRQPELAKRALPRLGEFAGAVAAQYHLVVHARGGLLRLRDDPVPDIHIALERRHLDVVWAIQVAEELHAPGYKAVVLQSVQVDHRAASAAEIPPKTNVSPSDSPRAVVKCRKMLRMMRAPRQFTPAELSLAPTSAIHASLLHCGAQ
eukprot:CAMPEP_0170216544 /NCGR_PEP_ID=MMETSP0116_2-20130129/7935_1 /TAXON_ID=400756 /ORGANISM="Durinskia baltica, Strain CSIRO CS-38" /LENGTH=223 /DNA_ID=CAMNT_0010467173 /DNA_START=34 /DNA_END=704 /DNA_ORIENTATION=+